MPIRILPFVENTEMLPRDEMQVTLGANPCLPAIVAEVFGWQAVTIEIDEPGGGKQRFGACVKGRKIVMLPYFSYGPPATEATARSLIRLLTTMGYRAEWRLTQRVSRYAYSVKVASVLDLQASVELQMDALTADVKRKIRKAQANGITVTPGGAELLDTFYSVFEQQMHRHGSPALPKIWFKTLLEKYRHGEASVWCAWLDGKAVGVAFMLEYRGFYEACWVANLVEFKQQYVSYALYWGMIRHAIEEAGIQFSFGRSTRGSSAHRYKQQWTRQELQLVWNYTHPRLKNIREYRILHSLWRFLPLKLVRGVEGWLAGRIY